jgi:hypothetical protein
MKREQNITREDGVRARRVKTEQGCMVERVRLRGAGGTMVEHVTLWTELELAPHVRETVLAR